MDCNEVRDLLTDYHLGNLSSDEAASVAAHIEDHSECREESESVERVLGMMALYADHVPPPPGARARFMQRMGEEMDGPGTDGDPLPATPARNLDSVPHRPGENGSATPRRRSPRLVPVLAVTVAVLALGLAGLAATYAGLLRENGRLAEQVDASRDAGGNLVVLAAGGTSLAPDARGMLVMETSEGQDTAVALGVYGMPDLPAGDAYRVWAVEEGGEHVSLGVMETDERGDGRMQGEMPRTDDPVQRVEITAGQTNTAQEPGPVYLRADIGE